ncbi:MAG: TonB-dependent receptor [Acidobacteria bacterium]|nr:TonB-dependent receptor [Acidobacteriota bacterium]
MASRVILSLVLFAITSTQLLAQERVGTVEGTVVDVSGSAIAGAALELKGGTFVKETSSNASGGYLIGAVPPGIYTLTVTAKGFTKFVANNLSVSVGRVTSVSPKMEVGQVTESISVSAEALQIDTQTNVVTTNVTAEMYDKLPKGRSFDTLLGMAPGTRLETKGGGYSVDGASGSENVYVVDGLEVTNIQTGVLNRQNRVPIEWIAETQLKSSGIDAQFGGATGGVVSATTRSGSNEFHGQASLYLSTDGMNAGPRPTLRLNPNNDDIADYFGNTRDGLRSLNPGFRLGGPILKNRIWFFTSAYPQFEKFQRNVRFLSGQSGVYERRDRQDFILNKVDYQVFSKLRTFFAHQHNPYKINGLLPSQQGTDSFATPFSQRGSRSPMTSYNYQADYTAANNLLFSVFGGYQYTNFADYGIPRGTRYRYQNSNRALPFTNEIPASLLGAAGNFTPDNRQTTQDIYKRNNVNAMGSWLFNKGGQHNVKFGWTYNNMMNSPVAGAWADGYIFIYWNQGRNALTTPERGARGPYGYYINRSFATQGDVSGRNMGIFFNDSWRVNRKLTLNLGLRTENEFIPSYRTDSGIASRAISFGWGDKFAPRVGFAYDPSGEGKMKFFGSYSVYFDLFKYELPRSSFGGDKWKDYYYTLTTTNIFDIKVTPGSIGNAGTFPGRLIEVVDNRIPSNDPTNNLIDPDLKPMQNRAFDFGFEKNFAGNYLFRSRYSRKSLIRTIEDVGILTPQGEQYYIANPGFGYTIDPKRFPAGYPANVTPKAQRDYDALELSVTKRFAGTFVNASYTLSRLYGNYSGLASSDENGRTSPNVNRYFDEAWMSYDQGGKLVTGRLATDRPHTFKLFTSYNRKWLGGNMHFAPVVNWYSGTPLTTEVQLGGVPVYPNGRGDLGRTPMFFQGDLLLTHDVKLKSSDTRYFRLELNVTNLFNNAAVTNKSVSITHPNDGDIQFANTADIFKGYSNYRALMRAQDIRVNPQFGLASAFQGPRTLRMGFHFFF